LHNKIITPPFSKDCVASLLSFVGTNREVSNFVFDSDLYHIVRSSSNSSGAKKIVDIHMQEKGNISALEKKTCMTVLCVCKRESR